MPKKKGVLRHTQHLTITHASLLWDLYDDNGFRYSDHNTFYTGTNSGPRGQSYNSYHRVATMYPEYHAYYNQFPSSWVKTQETSLDTISIGLDKVFAMVREMNADSSSPYYYDSDIFTRLRASASLLGISSSQIENLCDLHGENFYDYLTKEFVYPNH